jgi:hypothetical protein
MKGDLGKEEGLKDYLFVFFWLIMQCLLVVLLASPFVTITE